MPAPRLRQAAEAVRGRLVRAYEMDDLVPARHQTPEALRSGLAVEAAAELDRMPVADPRGAERAGGGILTELLVAPGARIAADTDERLDCRALQAGQELLDRTPAVTDRPGTHGE